MGRIVQYTCKTCGHTWTAFEGVGFNDILEERRQRESQDCSPRNNQKNKQSSAPSVSHASQGESHGAGDTHNEIRCPKCQSTDLVNPKGEFVGLWD